MEVKSNIREMYIFFHDIFEFFVKKIHSTYINKFQNFKNPKGLDFYLKECTIDDDPIINNKQWSLHHAQLLKHPNPMSVFIGKEDSSSLEKFAKVKYLWHLNVEVNFQL